MQQAVDLGEHVDAHLAAGLAVELDRTAPVRRAAGPGNARPPDSRDPTAPRARLPGHAFAHASTRRIAAVRTGKGGASGISISENGIAHNLPLPGGERITSGDRSLTV